MQPSRLLPKQQRPLKSSYCWSPERVLCFDLENRPLAYWYDGQTTSEITAFAWKWSDEGRVHAMLLGSDGSFRYKGPLNAVLDVRGTDAEGSVWMEPRSAYQFFVSELRSADLVYGHNIRKHDLPMLNAGLLRRQLPILPPLLTTDTLRDYPRRGGMSASLENLASYYGLEGEKLKMTQHMWEEANRLKPDGIELARERVEGDVLLQERLRGKLLELGLLSAPRTWRP